MEDELSREDALLLDNARLNYELTSKELIARSTYFEQLKVQMIQKYKISAEDKFEIPSGRITRAGAQNGSPVQDVSPEAISGQVL